MRTTEKQQYLPCAHTTPDAFLDKVKAKEPLVVLDVSTPAESGVYSVALPGTLIIPINELFTESNLALIPTDKTVVVLCKSGTRATAAGTARLQFEIGIDSVLFERFAVMNWLAILVSPFLAQRAYISALRNISVSVAR